MGENKMSAIFYDDDILVKYEQQEQWDDSVEYLNNLMYSQSQNKSVLYRLAAQSWYVLTFWHCNMPKDKLNRNVFELGLKKAYTLAKEKWWTDSDCLWLFGYFMCINQMDFPYVSTDIREVEKVGNDLISKAYFNEPNNQLAEILYLADNGSKRKYMEALKKCKRKITIYFPHQSAVEQYFSEIFTSDQ